MEDLVLIKVITYGTYDFLHEGHIRLLKRAKALGDYLIVGVTADDFDKTRGKINVQQSLMERIEAVRSTGIADEIIIEEYEGQKIDDIKRMDIDIFTVGSDWKGKFDYLNEFCKVVYLDRTEGISSSQIRGEKNKLRIGLVGEANLLLKFKREADFVNGVKIISVYTHDESIFLNHKNGIKFYNENYEDFLNDIDAVYIVSHPSKHYEQIKQALYKKKHILCESPLVTRIDQWNELTEYANEHKLILMDSLKTAYSIAYYRLLLLAKSGRIGNIVSIDATCTSLQDINYKNETELVNKWNSICSWGPTALLPIFQLLGTKYKKKIIISKFANKIGNFDTFTKIDFIYDSAVASLKVGKGIKSEGELIITGDKGYIYVPAPWWKTDYFEIRYEDSRENKRYFYQLDGEGIRYEIVSFSKTIESGKQRVYIDKEVSKAIVEIIENMNDRQNIVEI